MSVLSMPRNRRRVSLLSGDMGRSGMVQRWYFSVGLMLNAGYVNMLCFWSLLMKSMQSTASGWGSSCRYWNRLVLISNWFTLSRKLVAIVVMYNSLRLCLTFACHEKWERLCQCFLRLEKGFENATSNVSSTWPIWPRQRTNSSNIHPSHWRRSKIKIKNNEEQPKETQPNKDWYLSLSIFVCDVVLICLSKKKNCAFQSLHWQLTGRITTEYIAWISFRSHLSSSWMVCNVLTRSTIRTHCSTFSPYTSSEVNQKEVGLLAMVSVCNP